jgi:hypothetical protein
MVSPNDQEIERFLLSIETDQRHKMQYPGGGREQTYRRKCDLERPPLNHLVAQAYEDMGGPVLGTDPSF